MTSVLQYATDWLLTWLTHATVACLLTLVAGRWLVADPRLRDPLWKAALLLPLGTSLVSVAAHPITSSGLELATFARPHMPFALRSTRVAVETTGGLANSAQIRVQDSLVQWLCCLVLATTLIPGIVATSRLVQSRWRFRQHLRTRRPTDGQELGIDARALSLGHTTARISVAPQVGSAAAVGRHEICISDDFLTLGRMERRGVLAHEMAHLKRRDPTWIALADVVASALAVQPLVSVVVRRLRRDAEFVCDEIAVRQTGDAAAYVRALTLFASKHAGALPAAALAYGSSRIVERAERVLRLRSRYRPARARIAVGFVATIVVITLLSLPRVRIGDEAGSRVRTLVSTRVSPAARPQTQIHVTVDVR